MTRVGSDTYKLIGDPEIKHAKHKGIVALIEPDASVREALVLLLQSEGWIVNCLEGFDELTAQVGDLDVVALVSETNLPAYTPQEILKQCRKDRLPVIFTGHDLSLQGAVDLIRQGAVDFLDKPFPQGRLINLLNGIQERGILTGSKE